MKRDKTTDFEKKITEVSGRWQAPFGSESKELARGRVMSRIAAAEALATHPVDRGRTAFWRAAAVLLLLIASPYLVYHIGKVQVVNGTDKALQVFFPDGSSSLLASEASLEYHKWGWKWSRSAALQGDASFSVLPGRNFEVRTAEVRVQVVGTVFSVWSLPDGAVVHCTEGEVNVANSMQSTALKEGHILKITREVEVPEPVYFSTDTPLLPISKDTIHFDQTPLAVVCMTLEKVYGHEVRYKLDDSLRYSGTIFTNRKEETFKVLCKTFGATLVVEEDVFTLLP